jgi:hypothetical protein
MEGSPCVVDTVNPACTLSKPNGVKRGCDFLRRRAEEDRYISDVEFARDPPILSRNYQ